MNDNLLQKLANIAVVRQHINNVVNSNTADRKYINPIQKIGRELDAEFVNLLITKDDESLGISEAVTFDSTVTSLEKPSFNFVKIGDVEAELNNALTTEPSAVRPKIKTSKKRSDSAKE